MQIVNLPEPNANGIWKIGMEGEEEDLYTVADLEDDLGVAVRLSGYFHLSGEEAKALGLALLAAAKETGVAL